MAQFGRPYLDIATNGWTASSGSALYAMIDESTFSDTDYIDYNGVAYCEVQLTSLNTPNPGDHIVRYRMGRSRTDRTLTLVVRLIQNTTEIASWTHVDPDLAFTSASQVLTAPQVSSISDYTDLRLRFDITALQNSQVHAQVSWAEMEIPDASSGSTIVNQIILSGNENYNFPNLNTSINQSILSANQDYSINDINIPLGYSSLAGNLNYNLNATVSALVQVLISWAELHYPTAGSAATTVSGSVIMAGSNDFSPSALISFISSLIIIGNLNYSIDGLLNVLSDVILYGSSGYSFDDLLITLSTFAMSGQGNLASIASNINIADLKLYGDAYYNFIGFLIGQVLVSWVELSVPSEQVGVVTATATMFGNLSGVVTSILTILSIGNIDGQLDTLINSLISMQSLIDFIGSDDLIASPILNVVSSVSIDAIGYLLTSGVVQAIASTNITGQADLIASILNVVNGLIEYYGSIDSAMDGLVLLQGLIDISLSSDLSASSLSNIFANLSMSGIATLLAHPALEGVVTASTLLDGSGTLLASILGYIESAIVINGLSDEELYGLINVLSDVILNGSLQTNINSLIDIQGSIDLYGYGYLIAIGILETVTRLYVSMSGQGDLISQSLSIINNFMELNGALNISPQAYQIIYGLLNAYGLGVLSPYVVIEGLVTSSVLLAGLLGYQSSNAFINIFAQSNVVGQVSQLIQCVLGIFAQSMIDGDEATTLSSLTLIQSLSQLIGTMSSNLFGKNYDVSYVSIQNELLSIGYAAVYIYATLDSTGGLGYNIRPILIMPSSTLLAGNALLDASGMTVAIGQAQISLSAQSELIATALSILNGQTIFSGAATDSLFALLSIASRGILNGSLDYQIAGNLIVQIITILSGLGALYPSGDIVTSLERFIPLERTLIVSSEDRIYIINKEGRIFIINEEDRTYWINKYRL